ncbi:MULTISPECIES: AraC family transcriptional regulator N-terminal domain-containing protein [unclassified Paraburkholderia]
MDDDFETNRRRLAARIARWTGDAEQHGPAIAGLTLHRHTHADSPFDCLMEPAIAVPVQGVKQTWLGSEVYALRQASLFAHVVGLASGDAGCAGFARLAVPECGVATRLACDQ